MIPVTSLSKRSKKKKELDMITERIQHFTVSMKGSCFDGNVFPTRVVEASVAVQGG